MTEATADGSDSTDDQPLRIERMRVLVIDEEPNMRKLIRTFLRSVGVESMLESSSAEEALAILRTNAADLLLTECSLKPVDGFSLVRQIRGGTDGINDELPIIMMSGQTSRKQIIDARNIGANEFVAKPLSVKVLRQRIESIVERPRPFVRTRKYTGPCRRRRAEADYAGPERRGNDEAVEMSQDDINDLLDALQQSDRAQTSPRIGRAASRPGFPRRRFPGQERLRAR